MPRRVNPGGSSLRLAAALAGKPLPDRRSGRQLLANWPASPSAPRRRRHPGTTAGSPTRASGQLITLWWRLVSCPVTRETEPLRGRPRAADQPAYPAAARSSGTRQSLPDSAVPIVAWRIPARPGSVSSWSLDRMTASDFPMQIAQNLQNSMADLPVGHVHTERRFSNVLCVTSGDDGKAGDRHSLGRSEARRMRAVVRDNGRPVMMHERGHQPEPDAGLALRPVHRPGPRLPSGRRSRGCRRSDRPARSGPASALPLRPSRERPACR